MLRVAAYGVCFARDVESHANGDVESDANHHANDVNGDANHDANGGAVLLARWVSRRRRQSHWTLPGGGVEYGEDPFDAVVREVAEETGYEVEVARLLGVDSRTNVFGDGTRQHAIGIFYLVEIVGGGLRHETRGSTDRAEWFPLPVVSTLERATLVDVGLELARARPESGHTRPVAVAGLLKY